MNVMTKTVLAAATVLASMSCIAVAADLGRGPDLKGGYVAAAPDDHCRQGPFHGLYIGAQAGWVRADSNQLALNNDAKLSSKDDGLTIGGHVGYNLQCGRLLLGVEADINWLDVNPSGTLAGQTMSASYDYFGTLRGRVGLVHDNVLFYLTGGLAWANLDRKFDAPGLGFSQSNSDVSWGWTAGGGVELSRGHWSIRGEVLYVSLPDRVIDYTFTGPCVACTAKVRWDDDFVVARVGVSVKLHRDEPRHEPIK